MGDHQGNWGGLSGKRREYSSEILRDGEKGHPTDARSII